MAYPPDRRVELGDCHVDLFHVGVLLTDLFDQAVGDVLQQPRAFVHYLYRNAIEFFVVDRTPQAVVLSGFLEIGMDGNIQRILVTHFLLLVVVAVIRKKLQPFE